MEEQNQEFQAGLESELTLYTETHHGEKSNMQHRDHIEVLIENSEKEVIPSIICQREDGKFHLKFTPRLPGTYKIKIDVNGEKLAKSPIFVQVKERQFDVVGELDLQGEKLKGPSGVAVNSKGEIAATDFDGHFVVIFNEDGKYSKRIGFYGDNTGQLKFPIDVIYVTDDVILVADEWNHRIQQFNIRTGEVVRSFGKFGVNDGEFASPVGVCLNNSGNVVVAELNNNRVQVLTPNGQTLYKVGDRGEKTFDHPMSCITHKNLLIVSDSRNNCIKVFEISGKFLYKFGKEGKGDGQFKGPSGLCVDKGENLLVCDKCNGRIQQFTLEGRFTGKSAAGALQNPRGITTTQDGRVLVTDYMARKIYILK